MWSVATLPAGIRWIFIKLKHRKVWSYMCSKYVSKILTSSQNGSCILRAGEGEMGLRPIYWAIIPSIMNQSWQLGKHTPLKLLLDESFFMLTVHLWPFSLLNTPTLSSFVPTAMSDWRRISGRFSFLTARDRKELNSPTSFIKTLSVTSPQVMGKIHCRSVRLGVSGEGTAHL